MLGQKRGQKTRVAHDSEILQGDTSRISYARRDLENGYREMRSKGSGAADSEFIEIIMRIIEEEREFLEQIGRL